MKRLLLIVMICSLLGPVLGVSAHGSPEHDHVNILEQGGSSESKFAALTEAVQQSNLVIQIKQKLAQAQYRFYLLENNLEGAKVNLEEVQEMITHLEEVVEDLDQNIEGKKDQILSVKTQTEVKKIEIADLEIEVQELQKKKAEQLKVVEEFMELLYLQRGVYFSNNEVNAVKLLASPNSVSENLQDITYLNLMEEENKRQIIQLEFINDELTMKWTQLRKKQNALAELDAQLGDEVALLKEEKTAQEKMLSEMRAEESILLTMLDAADDNQESLTQEIQALEKSLKQMEESLGGTLAGLSIPQQEIIAKIEEEMSNKYDAREASGVADLQWPVSPERGLTAFFIDEGYVNTFGVQHYALDVRATQGTPIYAASDGMVFDIKFDPESTNYAYVMLAHRKGVMTLAGHVSGLAMKNGRQLRVGDFVQQGETIGFSGGMPGTTGAGARTTGPHLHFEVWQDGARVDPLLYLPLEEVPDGELPEEYLKEMQRDLEDEIREIQEALGL